MNCTEGNITRAIGITNQPTTTASINLPPKDEDAVTSQAGCKVMVNKSPPAADFSFSLSSLTNAKTSTVAQCSHFILILELVVVKYSLA